MAAREDKVDYFSPFDIESDQNLDILQGNTLEYLRITTFINEAIWVDVQESEEICRRGSFLSMIVYQQGGFAAV